jgi:hypothetical protein
LFDIQKLLNALIDVQYSVFKSPMQPLKNKSSLFVFIKNKTQNMRKLVMLSLLFIFSAGLVLAQEKEIKEKPKVDTRIDNMRYWNDMIKKGFAIGNPVIKIEQALYRGTSIDAKSVKTEDSPDVPVSQVEQTETSVFVSPTDNSFVMNSNNSGNSSNFYGANFFYSSNAGGTWGGQVEGAGGSNSGDPAILMALNGRKYVGYIHNNYGQGVSFTDNDGANWTNVQAGTNPGDMLDKNHLWIDNSPTSPYVGYIYDAWTDFGGTYDSEIGFVRTTNGGTSYGSKIILSQAVNAGSHNQGVNIQTGSDGQVYVVWAIYDSWPSDETAMGFAKSTDGGATFAPSSRIITNIKGIRTTEVLKNHRVNSFPSMAVDISGGTYNGNIYIVWSNVGVPGTNTGTNKSVYMIRSTDEGATWSTPIRVNQGANTNGKEAYFPWITCDPENGTLSVIFYDDRNVSSTQVETWVANSYDGGETWEDFRVSDVAFTPAPLAGMAGGYMGDYLGIAARGGMVYPMWPDNRTGALLTYVSPFETNNRIKPIDLQINLTEGTGQVDLSWSYTEAKTMQYFVVYRDNVQIGTTTETNFTNMLPAYGVYSFSVTAMHDDGESSAVKGNIQWGNPNITVSPSSLNVSLLPNQTTTKVLTVNNIGELGLTYNILTAITSKENNPKAYCDAAGAGDDEYISSVVFGSINNTSGYTPYSDFTAISTDVDAGNTYPITITNGTVYTSDDLGIWIDWNQDEDFEDAGENVVCEISNSGQGTYNIFVPDDALGGSTRMRIRIKWSGEDCGSPCGTTTYGEVEDYTVNVNSWLQVGSYSGSVAPGSSEQINVNVNSTDLALGDYFATITFNSNDTDQPVVDVPVVLHVLETMELQVSSSADDYEICTGSSTVLHSNAAGGTGVYTYSWTSIPAGFTSSDENPTVNPNVNTVYTVVVNDGSNNISGEVAISIIETPGQADTPTGVTELCQNGANTAYVTNEVTDAASYVWSISPSDAGTISGTGLTGNVDWAPAFFGVATISVSAANNCGSGTASTGLSVTVNELPDVTISDIDDVCIDAEDFTLTGGSPVGGTYSGNGVTAGVFSPTTADVGNHTIIYTFSDGTCDNSAQTVITVRALPVVTLAAFDDVDESAAPFTLTGGLPLGGIYSGTGVSDGMFYPGIAGMGTHTITYTYSNAYGCENSAQQTITVDDINSVNTINAGINIEMYPNPNNGILFLNINSIISKELSVTIMNEVGMAVLNTKIQVDNKSINQIDLSQLASGLYFISIKGEMVNTMYKVALQK